MPTVNSVLGPLESSELGMTLPHEHALVSSAAVPHTYPETSGRKDIVKTAIAAVGKSRLKRVVWTYAPRAGIHGQLMENLLPTFWSDRLSRVFANASYTAWSMASHQPDRITPDPRGDVVRKPLRKSAEKKPGN